MALAGSSETIETGGIIATNTVNSKEHQVLLVADYDGHLVGSRPDYMVSFTPQTNAANREVGEIFNGSADKILRIRGIWLMPTQTVIVGATQQFEVNKISAVGTGLTNVVPRPMDSSIVADNFTNITFGYGSTGGATLAHQWFPIFLFNDETRAETGLIAYINQLPQLGDRVSELVLRQNEGVQVKQIAGSVGLTGLIIHFAIDN